MARKPTDGLSEVVHIRWFYISILANLIVTKFNKYDLISLIFACLSPILVYNLRINVVASQ